MTKTKGNLLGRNGLCRNWFSHSSVAWSWAFGLRPASLLLTSVLADCLPDHFSVCSFPGHLKPLRLCPAEERSTLQDETPGSKFSKEKNSSDNSQNKWNSGDGQGRTIRPFIHCCDHHWFCGYPFTIYLHKPSLSAHDSFRDQHSLAPGECCFLSCSIQSNICRPVVGHLWNRLMGGHFRTTLLLSPKKGLDHQTAHCHFLLRIGRDIDLLLYLGHKCNSIPEGVEVV